MAMAAAAAYNPVKCFVVASSSSSFPDYCSFTEKLGKSSCLRPSGHAIHSSSPLSSQSPSSPAPASASPSSSAFCSRRSTSVQCNAQDLSVSGPLDSSPPTPSSDSSEPDDGPPESQWVAVMPVQSLPRTERRIIKHYKDNVLLLWHGDQVYALENRSPAATGYREGFLKAVVNEDASIVCPCSQSVFDLKTGLIKEWLPNSSFLAKVLTPALSDLIIYGVKIDSDYIYISKEPLSVDLFAVPSQVEGDVRSTNEKPLIFDELDDFTFGFTPENEVINGRTAMLGFVGLLMFEMVTGGQGILKASGILDFLYQYLPGFPVLKY